MEWQRRAQVIVRILAQAFRLARSFNADEPLVVLETEKLTHQHADSWENEPVQIDFESIPTVDLDGIEYVSIEDVVIVDCSQDLTQEDDLSVEPLKNAEPVDDADCFQNACANVCFSSDSEASDRDSSDDESDTGEDAQVCVQAVDVDAIVENNLGDSERVAENFEIQPISSNVPPNTPAAFAKVLFFPGEKHLSEKKKRSLKKCKVPSVYTSDQYLGYLKEKEQLKDEKERLKIQRKMEREGVKQRKEDEKKVREAKRAERKDAMAVKKAELASKKVEAAKRKADVAAKKADDAAKKASSKYLSSSASAKKRKIDATNQNDPENVPH